MEKFTVTSSDKALLRAFIEKLEEIGYIKYSQYTFNLDDFEKPHIIVYDDKIYDILNHSGGYELYNLPHQWLSAVDHLKSFKSQYEINSFVIMKGLDGVWKINEYLDHLGVEVIRYVKKNNNINIIRTEHPNNIERYATKNEIYDELIQLTDIKVGDKVKYINDDVNFSGIVEKIDLYSRLSDLSKAVKDYYTIHNCDFLVAMWNNANYAPVNKLLKISTPLTITTNRTQYVAESNNNNYNIGCVKNINVIVLHSVIHLMKLCKENDLNLYFNSHGEIDHARVGKEQTNSIITLNDIYELIENLKY